MKIIFQSFLGVLLEMSLLRSSLIQASDKDKVSVAWHDVCSWSLPRSFIILWM